MDDRIVKQINEQEEIVTFEDGFKYYWPVSNRGAFSSHDLRTIADYLDELNKDWQAQVEATP